MVVPPFKSVGLSSLPQQELRRQCLPPIVSDPFLPSTLGLTHGPTNSYMLVLGLKDPHTGTSKCLAFRKYQVNLLVNTSGSIGAGGYRYCDAAMLETLGMKVPVVAKQWKAKFYSDSASTYLWDSVVYMYAQYLILTFQKVISQCPSFPAPLAFEAQKLRVSLFSPWNHHYRDQDS